MRLRFAGLILLLFFLWSHVVAQGHYTVTFQFRAHTSMNINVDKEERQLLQLEGTYLDGIFPVTLQLVSGQEEDREVVWEEYHGDVRFSNGFSQLLLGAGESEVPLTPSVFSSDLVIHVRVHDNTFEYQIRSVPYAMRVQTAESVGRVSASKLVPGGVFYDPVVIEKDLVVLPHFHVLSGRNQVSIMGGQSHAHLDVGGTLNAMQLLVNNEPIEKSFVWQKSDVSTENIYVSGKKIGIGTSLFGDSQLRVIGPVNATQYLRRSKPLSSSLDWVRSYPNSGDEDHFDLFLESGLNRKVGIGVNMPVEQVDVFGGVQLSDRHLLGVDPEDGSLRFVNGEFQGFLGGQWYPFPGLEGLGKRMSLAYFSDASLASHSQYFNYDSQSGRMGLGVPFPQYPLHIQGIAPENVLVSVSTGNQSYFELKGDGALSIATRNSSEKGRLTVAGVVEASELLVYGIPIRLALTSSDIFLRNLNRDIFYNAGKVGIGVDKLKTTVPSVIEVGAPFTPADQTVPVKDPAVTFTLARDGPSDIAYTMGVDAENPDVFKVEKSTLGDVFYPLGHSPPLFVIKKNLFGMGVNRPDSNLHVSGNSGLLISAQLRPTSPVQLQQSVPQLVFDGTNAAFFVGESAVVSTQNMGKYSVVMGKDSVASGIFSAAYGRDNQSKGAYATAFSGKNNRSDGYFSLALGSHAVAAHDGSFVWSSHPLSGAISELESKSENQFLIRALGGVGIGTSQASDAALLIAGKKIYPSSFMPALSFEDSYAVFQSLQSKNYLDQDGNFKHILFDFDLNSSYFVFPVQATIASADIYSVLRTLYADASLVQDESFVTALQSKAVLSYPESGKLTWLQNLKRDLSRSLWKELIEDDLIYSNGEAQNWTPSTVLDSKYLYTNTDPDKGWVEILASINEVISDALSDPNGRVQSFLFEPLIAPSLYDESEWTSFFSTGVFDLLSVSVKEELLRRGYIDEAGAFKQFRPIELESLGVAGVATANVFSTLRTVYDSTLLRSSGVNDVTGLVIKHPAYVGIGVSDPAKMALAVSGSVVIGQSDVPDAQTPLIVSDFHDPTVISTANLALMIRHEDDSVSQSALVVNSLGKVGMGAFPDTSTEDIRLVISGGIKAGIFEFPSGETLSPKPPYLVWHYETTSPNIYFATGNVGIGSVSPNSLLELSSVDGNDPVITYDLDSIDYYSVGVSKAAPAVFQIQPGGTLSSAPRLFSMRGRGVGIGTDSPISTLQVSGNSVFSNWNIPSTTLSSDAVRASIAYVGVGTKSNGAPRGFFVKGSAISASGVPWVSTQNALGQPVLYRELGLPIGIGTARATYPLEVSGNIAVSGNLYVQGDMQLQGGLTLDALGLRADVQTNYLFLEGDAFIMTVGSLGGIPINISEVFSGGLGVSGNLTSFLSTGSTLIEAPILWVENPVKETPLGLSASERRQYAAFQYDDAKEKWLYNSDYDASHPGLFTGTANLRVFNEESDTVDVSHLAYIQGNSVDQLMRVYSQLGYQGSFYTDSASYNAVEMKFDFSDTWVNNTLGSDEQASLVGIAVSLNSKQNASLTSQTKGVGVYVDVRGVKLQTEGVLTRGFARSGLFMGDVGVGVEPARPTVNIYPTLSYEDALAKLDDTAVLAVLGEIKATDFNISDRLILTTINVKNAAFSVQSNGHVGIGAISDAAKFNIDGRLVADSFQVSTGLNLESLSFDNDRFRVGSDGFVGLGATAPENYYASLELRKHVDDAFLTTHQAPFSFHSIDVVVSKNVDFDISGLEVSVTSSARNFVGKASEHKGIFVDLTGLNSARTGSTANVVGVYASTPSKDDVTPTPSVAVFRSGIVGIGTRNPDPQYALDVKGTLRASNSTAIEFVDSTEAMTVDELTVTDEIRFGQDIFVTMNHLEAYNKVSVPVLQVLDGKDQLNLPIELSVEGQSQAQNWKMDFISAKNLDVQEDFFVSSATVNAVGIGQAPFPTDFKMTAGIDADALTASKSMTASVFRHANLSIDDERSLGIVSGTGPYPNFLTIGSAAYTQSHLETPFDVANNATWKALRYDVKGSARGVSAGAFFAVDSNPLTQSGMGILAVKTSDSVSGSDLVFVANKEVARLNKKGFLGIGTDNASQSLHVLGQSQFENMSAFQRVYSSGQLTGIDGLTIHSPLQVSVTTNMAEASIETGVYLEEGDVPTTVNNHIAFYASKSSKEFVLLVPMENGNFVTTNFSDSFDVSENQVAFYSQSGSLTDSDQFWIPGSLSVYRVSGSVEIEAGIPSTAIQAVYQPYTVTGLVPDRRAVNTSAIYSGLSIAHDGSKLNATDHVYGLQVDLSDLETKKEVSVDGDTVFLSQGEKLAAVFQGGYLGIDQSDATDFFRPSNSVHVRNEVTENYALLVQVTANGRLFDALSISRNAMVGIGTRNARARLSIDHYGGPQPDLFEIVTHTNADKVFSVDTSGVDIGSGSGHALTVAGDVTANKGFFGTLSLAELHVVKEGQSKLAVFEGSDKVGMGTATPDAQLHLYKALSEASSSGVKQVVHSVTLNGSTDALVGVGISVSANSVYDYIQGSESKLTGLKVDLSSLSIEGAPEKNWVGFSIDVSTSNAQTQRRAALFRSGTVGIGANASTDYALDVKGTIKGHDFYYANPLKPSSFFANMVSINALVVQDGPAVQGARLYVSGLDAVIVTNNFTFTDQDDTFNFIAQAASQSQLKLAGMSATTASLPTGSVILGQSGIAPANVDIDFFVSGNIVQSGEITFGKPNSHVSVNSIFAESNLLVSDLYVPSTVNIRGERVELLRLQLANVFQELDDTSSVQANDTLVFDKSGVSVNVIMRDQDTAVNLNDLSIYSEFVVTKNSIGTAIQTALPGVDLRIYRPSIPTLNTDSAFVYFGDGNLYLRASGNVHANLTRTFRGDSGKIPFFDSGNQLSDASQLRIRSDANSTVFQIASSSNVKVSQDLFTLQNTIGSAPISQFSAHSINTRIQRRITPADTLITGLDVSIVTSNLLGNDALYGVFVDLKDLEAAYTSELPGSDTQSGIKYSALFEGGTVAIVTSMNELGATSANVHVRNDGVKATQNMALWVQVTRNASTYDALVVRDRGTVGIGVRRPTANLEILKTEGPLLSINGTDSSLLHLAEGGTLGIGYENTAYTLGLQSSQTPLFRVGRNDVSENIVVIRDTFLGIGTLIPTASLSVFLDTGATFRVDNDALASSLVVTDNGLVGIHTLTPSYSFSVSGNVFSGDAMSDLEWSKVSQKPTQSVGFFSGKNQADRSVFAFLGLNNTLRPSFNSVIGFGGSSEAILTFETLAEREGVLYISSRNVGVLDSNPSYRLSIQGDDNPSFMVSSSEVTSNFYIDGAGQIGIGTAQPQSMLSVSGNILANAIQNYTGYGTRFNQVKAFIVSNNESESNFSSVRTVIDNISGKTNELLEVIVQGEGASDWGDAASYRTIQGVDISLSSAANKGFSSNAGNAYGLKVDVSNLLTEDPSFQGVEGNLVSAVFLSRDIDTNAVDVLVGVGEPTPNAALHVRGVSINVIPDTFVSESFLVTGDIVLFSTSKNGRVIFRAEEPTHSRRITDIAIGSKPAARKFTVPETKINEALQTISIDINGSVTQIGLQEAVQILATLRSSTALLAGNATGNYLTDSGETALINQDLNKTFSTALGDVPEASVRKVLASLYSRATMTFQIAPSNTSKFESALVLASGPRPIFKTDPLDNTFGGSIGVNLSEYLASANLLFNESLVVNHDESVATGERVALRIGKWSTGNIGQQDAPAPSARLLFSGGPNLPFQNSPDKDSENSDPLFIRRDNVATDVSSLEISIGENHTEAESRFVAGVSSANGTFLPIFTMRTASLSQDDGSVLPARGYVGIQDLLSVQDFSPKASLHIISGRGDDNEQNPRSTKNYMAVFEDTSNLPYDQSTAGILAIRYAASVPEEGMNFMSFLAGSADAVTNPDVMQSLGAIEGFGGQDNPGVAFSSPERDYAEYILKADPEEAIHPGEIVGIVKGCVTKKIEGAEQLMVMSSSPIIVGNWKASVPESHVALVAFLGQVPVKVIGPVNQGDYIVAEPTRPGIGRAVSLMDILPEDIDFIVGKAWESSDETAVKLINTVIGFPFGMTIVESRLSQLRSQLKKMSDDNAFLSKKYEGLLLAREEKISILKAKLKQQHVSSLKGASR